VKLRIVGDGLLLAVRDAPVSAKKVLETINKSFGTLPFCRRYLDRVGETAYLYGVRVYFTMLLDNLMTSVYVVVAKTCPRGHRSGLSTIEGSTGMYDCSICKYAVRTCFNPTDEIP